jgi:uncharacterized protein (UPF0276 family)
MISDRQKDLIERLNDMYQSQSLEYRNRYATNYFDLLEYIMNPYEVRITGEQIRNEVEAMQNARRRMGLDNYRPTDEEVDDLRNVVNTLTKDL